MFTSSISPARSSRSCRTCSDRPPAATSRGRPTAKRSTTRAIPRPARSPTERDFWQQLYFHQLGTPVAKDRYELGKDFPKQAEIVLQSDTRGRVLASVEQGDGGIFRYYLKDAKGWRQLADWDDQIALVVFGGTPDLWLVSRKEAPHGKLMKLAATAKTTAEATMIVPEGKDSIVTDFHDKSGVLAVGDRVYVNYQLGGPSEVRAFSIAGKPQKAPVGPAVTGSTRSPVSGSRSHRCCRAASASSTSTSAAVPSSARSGTATACC